jgi:hypothetical protein
MWRSKYAKSPQNDVKIEEEKPCYQKKKTLLENQK